MHYTYLLTYNLAVLCLVAQLCLTICDLMDCSPPGSSIHRILQVRILEWVVIPSSRGSSQPRGQTQVSHTAGGFFTVLATRAAHNLKFSKIFQYCLQTGFYVVSLKIKSLNQLIHASYSLDNLYKHFKCKVHKTLHTI